MNGSTHYEYKFNSICYKFQKIRFINNCEKASADTIKDELCKGEKCKLPISILSRNTVILNRTVPIHKKKKKKKKESKTKEKTPSPKNTP